MRRVRRLTAWEGPLLAAVLLAPVIAGGQSPLADLSAAGLVALSLSLRLFWPGWRERPLRIPRAGGWALGLATLAFISLVWSVNRGDSLRAATLLASFAAALILAADLRWQAGGPERLLAALAISGGVVAILGLREYVLNALVFGNAGWRVFSRFANPNLFASYLLLPLLLTLAAYLRRPKEAPARWRPLIGLGLALLFAAFLLTGSRAAMGVLIGGGLVFAAAEWRKGTPLPAGWLKAAVALVIVLAAVGLIFSRVYRGRQATPARRHAPQLTALAKLCPLTVGEEGQSWAFRKVTWAGTARMIRARPWRGFGAGSFPSIFPRYQIAGFTRMAHQSYLQLAAELGLPGLLLWLGVIGAAALGWLRQPRAWWLGGLAGALAAALAHNLVDSPWYVVGTALPMWALLGLAAAPAPPAAETPARPRSRAAKRLAAAALLVVLLWQLAGWVPATLGNRWRSLGNDYRAAGALRLAMRILPVEGSFPYELAPVEARRGNSDAGRAAARRAVELAPTRPPYYYRYAQGRLDARDYAGAEAALRRAIAWGPNDVISRWERVGVLRRLNRLPEAEEEARAILRIEASPVDRVRALGGIRERRYAEAHLFLAERAAARGEAERAYQEFLAAGCRLLERRLNFYANRLTSLAANGVNPVRERRLTDLEAGVWQRLLPEFRRRGLDGAAADAEQALQDLATLRGNLTGERGIRFLLEGK